VTEYWNDGRKAWVLVDAQLDARQRELFKVRFDPLDVPHDHFLVAGAAWQRCPRRQGRSAGLRHSRPARPVVRRRQCDPRCRRAERPRDAAVGRVGCDGRGRTTRSTFPLIDRLAALTVEPDRHFGELRAAYQDPRIKVPGTVFNAVLNRPETP
jgi:hypothetical protein